MWREYAPLLLLALSFALVIPTPTHATAYSIPVNGRFATSRIALQIPSSPKWAHDIVLNASLAWNNGQLWFQHTYYPEGNVYTFTESNEANVTINFAIPPACAGLAVGWTDYTFALSSTTIVSARTYLDPTVFNAAQGYNATARQYAFRLALHELGRVLGLGNLIDGNDIMDPLGTPNRATQTPMISTLDLFAVHMLASENTLSSMVIVLNTDQYQLLNAWSLLTDTNEFVSSLDTSAKKLANLHMDQEISNVNKPSNVDHPKTTPSIDQLPQHSALTGYATLLMLLACAGSAFAITRYRSKRPKGTLANRLAPTPSENHFSRVTVRRRGSRVLTL